MVHHARGLPRLSNAQEPSTYVKVYLQPDIQKSTKRKTKVVRKNCHPSFMEMVRLYVCTCRYCFDNIVRHWIDQYVVIKTNELIE